MAKKNTIENKMSDRKNNDSTLERKQKIEGKVFFSHYTVGYVRVIVM